ncbi:LysR family transcriptional regulator [Enterovirga rhinocerotis]|uniref:LysR family transcriptional regulator n=1 Tax=Enterovirga rhinocerotis TaxID=1339210 RepID=A0A4R7BYT8_9HYPH|nr:LysR family transcriptional regulator [Enterovirga rhinocerotis]TDR89216.1 LysR family transcriptional regulator [Enterovirga rhinocerotis]
MIRQLEFILALGRERHFGKAAAACNVSQPTLSNGVKALEDALGVLLVQRSSKFVGFTPEGERVVEWARRILGDVRGLRADLAALRHGLEGHVRIAAIPTALPMVAELTTPFRARYPAVRFSILSRTSREILDLLDNLEIEAGLSYLDNEPVGQVRTVPLYDERYHLLTDSGGPLGERASVTWSEVAPLPLCLLTPDMQNRRIIDQMLRNTGLSTTPTLVSNSTIVLVSHVRTGKWSSVLPKVVAESLGLPPTVSSIPIVDPDIAHSVGLIVADREPTTPLVAALLATAREVARAFAR